MRLAEQITALQAEVARYTELMTSMGTDDEGMSVALTDDEQALFNEYVAKIESCEGRIATMQQKQTMLAKLAKPVTAAPEPGTDPAPVAPTGIKVRARQRPKGSAFVSMAVAMYNAKEKGIAPADYARTVMDDHELASWIELPDEMKYATAVVPGSTKTTGYVEELTSFRFAAEQFIELLRPMTITGRLALRRFDFGPDDIWHIPRQTVASVGYWVGENAPIPVSRITVDLPSMNPRKVAGLAVTSSESMRRTNPAILEMLRDDQLEVVARTIDAMFMSATARAADDGVPGGLFKSTDPVDATAGTWATLGNISADLKQVRSHFSTAELSDAGVTLILHSDQLLAIEFATDPTTGLYLFRDEINSGTIARMPWIESNQADATVLHAIAANDVLMGQDMAPRVEITDSASIHMSDDPATDVSLEGDPQPMQHLWQTDSVGIRTIASLDWLARHANATYHLTGITGL